MQSTALTLVENSWRFSPARMAEHLTGGRFHRFRHIQFLDNKIAEAVSRGNGRLVISMPPRHGKSWLTSIYTPAWFLSLWPDRNVILTSYEATFAATWGRQVRNLIQEHGSTLGVNLAVDSLASDKWNTSAGGGMITAGIGGPITGRGGHLIIVDDPVKNSEEAFSENIQQRNIEWFNSTLYTRAEPGASIIILMTRWHERDLAGYLLNEHEDPWEEIKLPAIAEEGDPLGRNLGEALCPERYDVDALEQIRTAVGSRVWEGLYQQRPVAIGGNIIRGAWFTRYTTLPKIKYRKIFADTAQKTGERNDFSVFECWGMGADGKLYLIDLLRNKWEAPELERQAIAFWHKHNNQSAYPIGSFGQLRQMVCEDAASGTALIQKIKYMNQIPIRGVVRVKDKLTRVMDVLGYIESGMVAIPAEATYTKNFLAECEAFTSNDAHMHDDMIDCLADAVVDMLSTANKLKIWEKLCPSYSK